MHAETRTTDAKARLILPTTFAYATVVIEQASAMECGCTGPRWLLKTNARLPRNPLSSSRTATGIAFSPCLRVRRPRRRRSREPPLAIRPAVADWKIEPFGRSHDRSAVSCEKSSLDDLLRTRVSPYEKRRLGKMFVAVLEGEKRAMAYDILAASAVAFEHLPHEAATALPKHPIPLILLARLAFD